MKILSVNSINARIGEDIGDYIHGCEMAYRYQLGQAAHYLSENRHETPIVLLSGPSGSGKTTTALRLQSLLNSTGVDTFCISMDDYFLPLDDPRNKVDEKGEIDLEAPARLNIELLNDHLGKIFRCEEVILPKFDFANQESSDGDSFRRKPDQLMIIEGIHALNPEVTGEFHDRSACVYVSVRTRIRNMSDDIMHPAKVRLMRRMMRDKLFRGRSAIQTLKYFKAVERGELKYITPFKALADFDIDTIIPYELSVYKKFLLGELIEMDENPAYDLDIKDMISVLNEVDSIEFEQVPPESIIREFLGGSKFHSGK